jgi:hypothetical protein
MARGRRAYGKWLIAQDSVVLVSCNKPSDISYTLFSPAIEHESHRSVVQQLDQHVRGKDSGLHMSTLVSQPYRNLLV